jgi:hypothetical protein
MALGNGIIPSVGHTGICFDNAMAEAFNATIKKVIMPAGAGTGDRMRIGVAVRS